MIQVRIRTRELQGGDRSSAYLERKRDSWGERTSVEGFPN